LPIPSPSQSQFTTERKIALALFIALLAIAALGVAAVYNARNYLEAAAKVEIGQLKIESLANYLEAMQNSETGQLGYVMTGKAQYLEPYERATQVVSTRLGVVLGLFKDDSKAQPDMKTLVELTSRKLNEIKLSITTRESQGFEAARDIVASDVGKNSMDEIRVVVIALQALERGALGQIGAAGEYRLMRGTQIGVLFSILAMLMLVVAAVVITRDVRIRRSLEKQLHDLASRDPLTDLPNRRTLLDLFNYSLALARRNKRQLAVMYLDLDGFKALNDRWGHAAGDRILCEAAKLLKETARESDTVARLGGDEFAILIPDVSVAGEAAMLASRLLEALRPVHAAMAQDTTLGASIGIAMFPEDGATAEGLLHSADQALYRAKQAGKHRYQFFNEFVATNSAAAPKLREDLEHALERNEMHLVFQPIVELDTGRIVSAEALLRWQHSTLGDVSPDEFIPIAEASGLIVSLGAWVLTQACKQLKQWHVEGFGDLRVAVNIAAEQWRTRELPRLVQDTLMAHQLPPRALELEITERGLTLEPTTDELKSLKGSGVRLTLDDFGTGYSSLNYLKRYPIDHIKIDSTFVKGLPDDPTDSAVAGAMIAMGKRLGFGLIAEGVETAEQREFLLKQGCEFGQGFYFSKAITAQEISKLLKSKSILPEQRNL
jgi:diguanylate cyclase (GGDEF)-like protein